MLLEGQPDADGGSSSGLAGVSPPPLNQQAPQEFKATAQNPAVENSFEWRDLSRGFGLRMQIGPNDRRYRYARRVDLSIANQWCLGPEITKITPNAVDTTNGCSKFFEIGSNLYLCNGRYLHLRTSDSDWNTGRVTVASASSPVTANAAAFESGKAVVDVITFHSNAAGVANYAYLGMGDTEFIWRFDGTTFTQHASLTSRAWCQEGSNLWRSPSANIVAKVDLNSDPWNAANWSADNQFTIGDESSPINSMILTASGVMLFMKTDGIYTLDEFGKDHMHYSGMHFAVDAENGKFPYLSGNWVYCTYGGRHLRIGPNLELEPIGPERYIDNDSIVKGYITRGCETPFGNYAGLYNPDSDNSYLMKSNAWGLNDSGQYERVDDVWHGSLSNFVDTSQPLGAEDFGGAKIQAMKVSTEGAPTRHSRLYMGNSDGTIAWFDLPCTPNPMNCTDYKTAQDGVKTGTVWLPYWHAGFPNNPKDIRAGTAIGTSLAIGPAPAYYMESLVIRTAGAGTNYTAYKQTDGTPFISAVSGKRNGIGYEATLLDMAVNLYADTDTDSPILQGVGLAYAVKLPIQQIYPLNIIAESGLVNREGRRFTYGADRIRDVVKDAAGVTIGVGIYLPDELLHQLVLGQYTTHTMWDHRVKQSRDVITVSAVDADPLGAGVTVPSGSSLIVGFSVDSGTGTTTPSEIPGTNQLLLLSILQTGVAGGTTPAAPSAISGNGLTWVVVSTRTAGLFNEATGLITNYRLSVYRTLGTPTAGVITITVDATTASTAWSLDQFSNVDTSGTSGSGAVIQAVTNGSGSSADPTVLTTFANANNRPFAVFNLGTHLATNLSVLGSTGVKTAWSGSASLVTSLVGNPDISLALPLMAIGIEIKAATQA